MKNKKITEKPTSHVSRLTPHAIFRTRWGWTGLAVSANGVRAIVLAKPSRRAVERALRSGVSSNGHPADATRAMLRDAQRQVRRYLAGRSRALDFPVDLSGGTSFQRKVWQAALRIPFGRVRSYRWIASKLGGAPDLPAPRHPPLPRGRVPRAGGGLSCLSHKVELFKSLNVWESEL